MFFMHTKIVKKQISQLCIELGFIILSSVGALLSTHLFTDHVFSRDFYVYYTNITNFICLIVMVYCFANNLKNLKQSKFFEHGYKLDITKSVASILIAITFLIFNILLADFSATGYFLNLYNLLYHVVLPIWFVTYTLSTCTHSFVFAPFFAVGFEVVYVTFIFIRSLILNGQVGRVIFPYFFLNYQTLGVSGIFKWLIIMLIATLIVGYLFLFLQKLIINKNKK